MQLYVKLCDLNMLIPVFPLLIQDHLILQLTNVIWHRINLHHVINSPNIFNIKEIAFLLNGLYELIMVYMVFCKQ